ncbi:hypothetical protein D3C72_1052670 [compost metagenome]
MLQRADRGAEPGVVADGQQQVAAGRQASGEFGVDHFVADVRRNLVALGLQQRLVFRPAGEVRHGQVEELDQAAQHVLQRHILAKRHQLLLEVGAIAFTGDGDAVVVAALVVHHFTHRHAGDQRRMPFGGEPAHYIDVALGLVLEHRDRGFRPHQQVHRPGAEAQVTVQRQLRVDVCRVPFQVLLDIALDGRHFQRVARRLGPGMALERQAQHPRGQQQQAAHRQERGAGAQAVQVAQQGSGQGQCEGNQPHAAQRCQAGQRAVQLAVAGVEPGETGQEPAAEGLLQQPKGGEAQGVGQWCLGAPQPACPQPGGQGEEPGQGGEERQQQQDRQQRRGAAVGVHADVDPPGTGTVQAEAEPPATPHGLARAELAQAKVEQGDGQHGQGPDVERRQGQEGGGTGRQGQQVTGPAGAGDPTHVCP